MVVAVDTEEDNWGMYEESGATVRNIPLLHLLQERLDRWGAHATYLVNWPPLLDATAIEVLGELSRRPDVEIGTHCHIWNTPPFTGPGVTRSMMWVYPVEVIAAKLRTLTTAMDSELGLRPRSFRAGKWGFGTTVALALEEEGYRVDSSVTPFIDWRFNGGPNFSGAPRHPYRFHPLRPLDPDATGTMVEVPTTIGFLRGPQERAGRLRGRLEGGLAARLGVVGVLDRAGLLTRRWLSPEGTSGPEMIRLASTCVGAGTNVLVLSLHSSALLPGATPFVATESDRDRFLAAIDGFLEYAAGAGFRFSTLSDVAASVS